MPNKTTKIALERIESLFKQAEMVFQKNQQLAQRYIDLARKIAQRTRTHLPSHLRHKICRKCHSYLVPGSTSRYRIRQHRESHIAITCLNCGNIQRLFLKEKNNK
jgi:ribonuclease P protein subunit RPR2